ncbi:nicotinate-nucleotide--dimethylbenzimidazole phosphoribosyltransferase [Labilibaculum sp. A4]|uniref:nicotinate-nucleotide--dimethylbenzimidazole phosphoribosyltransferase n=1 Tax=Labilibaculum euxinus TaxID=2686357 RepID=UPI000F616093|nr:nicotinate-nucleotide--dimethylbenzimidazole phosphoribosyltransferase [Labilibaculum euxinus]MDQ1770293.1 nicotinate-nucleotide--dimethylbenzimidazole phosphoribosyltransferase [Labilibaculum euxinus]MWN75488.1 nicotinate-nucleotide--dimethylbenzimidazole phosphoribosyltransferase [Labilibaculum euxinus]
MNFNISKPNNELKEQLQSKIDLKTKPIGSLGVLEKLAVKIGCIQNTLSPELKQPTIMVFAADHGIALDGVSPYPQEVTWQMVANFLSGGAAINVFGRQNGIDIRIIDAGVNFDFDKSSGVINAKVNYGTKSYLNEPAMTAEQFKTAIKRGADLCDKMHREGSNIIGFGEMGIGNTSSAAILLHILAGVDLKECVGRGTGWDDEGLKKKYEILKNAVANYNGDNYVENILTHFGGFEIVMIAGAMLKAAELKMVILVDGFIISSALLAASKINSDVLEYCIFTHKSNENGHKHMLQHLKAEPILDLGMRLGEGTGAAVAYPIIESSVNFLNQMASFEDAGVSNSDQISQA